MRVQQLSSATEFLAVTESLRADDPVRTNVLGSVAIGVAEGRNHYDSAHWLVVEDDGGAVVGAALRTAPYRLLVSPMPLQAARAVGRLAVELVPDLAGTIGPEAVVHAVAEGAGRSAAVYMAERILVLREPRPPVGVPGRGRRATDDDVDVAHRWFEEFAVEAGVIGGADRDAIRRRIPSLWVWEDGGAVVSMAGHAPVVPTPSGGVGRVGPVYTPPEHRRRGYGAGVTWAVVEHLRTVATTVMLFTDAGNATSNAVYERLGFVHEDDVVDLDLLPL